MLPSLCQQPTSSSLHLSPKNKGVRAQERVEKMLLTRALSTEDTQTGQLAAAQAGLDCVWPVFEELLNSLAFIKRWLQDYPTVREEAWLPNCDHQRDESGMVYDRRRIWGGSAIETHWRTKVGKRWPANMNLRSFWNFQKDQDAN